MRYFLLIDPAVEEEIDSFHDLPQPVREGLRACLDDLEQNPHVDVTQLPVLGLCRVYKQDYGGIRWKILVFLDRDDDVGMVYVKQWTVITEDL